MPVGRDLAAPLQVEYIYDGSFLGFFCCVYESVYAKELPSAIYKQQEVQIGLFEQRRVLTDHVKAEKVRRSIPLKICKRALELIENVFLSCMQNKELSMLRFLLFAYRQGGGALNMLGHALVAPLLKAEKHLLKEAHLFTGFVRFTDYNGALVSVITPKNFVLPYIAGHFINRYYNEDFMIFDKTHSAALLYQNRKKQMISIEELELPDVPDSEREYQKLWKCFYDTVAIAARKNPKCRMTHMPKRFWQNMTEMQDMV